VDIDNEYQNSLIKLLTHYFHWNDDDETPFSEKSELRWYA